MNEAWKQIRCEEKRKALKVTIDIRERGNMEEKKKRNKL